MSIAAMLILLATASQAAAQTQGTPSKQTFAANIEAARLHLLDLLKALPTIPSEISRVAGAVASQISAFGTLQLIGSLAVFVASGFAAQWLFYRVTGRARAWIAAAPLLTVANRVTAIAARFAYSAALPLVFGLGSIGAFLAFTWPPLLGQIVLDVLVALVLFRLAAACLEFLLSPPGPSGIGAGLRVLPVSDAAAQFWVRRISLGLAWFAVGFVLIEFLELLGSPPAIRQILAYSLGTILLAIAVDAVWRRPRSAPVGQQTTNSVLSICLVLLWMFWVAGMMKGFWSLAVLLGLPAACMLAQRAVNNVLRPPGAEPDGRAIPSVVAAVVERGVRAALIIGAVVFLADKLGVNFTLITAQDAFLTRIIRGGLSAVVIILAADFFWHIARTIIDRKLADAASFAEVGTEEARRQARLRTLLPIARTVLKIAIALVAILMALSSLGVDIGPLVAGAGIFGVAIGFGAQTVVKDIISGIFYLLDDAFRVGEYIQSGSYKGTVESFSLRSVVLRHHRGSIFTVPFSDLGAVQNMSRDWVIEKIAISVTYDSDVAEARRIVKSIGQELAKDPEFAASTIEPLKMQGVDEFGESGMLLRLKLKTRPGEQFGIKRRALMLIKQAFDEKGIKLALPTVQVAGDKAQEAAAAHQKRTRQKTAAKTAAAG